MGSREVVNSLRHMPYNRPGRPHRTRSIWVILTWLAILDKAGYEHITSCAFLGGPQSRMRFRTDSRYTLDMESRELPGRAWRSASVSVPLAIPAICKHLTCPVAPHCLFGEIVDSGRPVHARSLAWRRLCGGQGRRNRRMRCKGRGATAIGASAGISRLDRRSSILGHPRAVWGLLGASPAGYIRVRLDGGREPGSLVGACRQEFQGLHIGVGAKPTAVHGPSPWASCGALPGYFGFFGAAGGLRCLPMRLSSFIRWGWSDSRSRTSCHCTTARWYFRASS
ncbi:hypothetical protein LCGC14_2470180 [marine sediment metagenome]|uniref:Uncharacterized protein n=1 Tax=marine sediment metagenome TaxID=412755 RepID=A0A0F9BAJ1_9ZZZZ